MASCIYGQNDENNDKGQYSRTEPLGAARKAPTAIAENMGSYVTPHVEITAQYPAPEIPEWSFLACGIDTLDLSVYVDWGNGWSSLNHQLHDYKTKAKSTCGPVLFQQDMLIYPGGKAPMYYFHLESPDLHFYLNQSGKSASQANCYASIGSKMLWQSGLDKSIQNLNDFVARFSGKILQLKPSRLDLCADFSIPGGLTFDLLRNLEVTRVTKTKSIMNSGNLETFYKGSSKGTIQLRIYNKALEILKSLKLWFLDVWGLRGIDNLENIWRVEFQLRRPALKAYGINDIPALINLAGGVWNDLTTNWYCLKLNDDSNATRRTVLPWWSAVSGCADKFGNVKQTRRSFDRSRVAQVEYYISRISNMFLSFSALTDSEDLRSSIDCLEMAIIEYWTKDSDNQDYFIERLRAKQIELSITPENAGGNDEIPF